MPQKHAFHARSRSLLSLYSSLSLCFSCVFVCVYAVSVWWCGCRACHVDPHRFSLVFFLSFFLSSFSFTLFHCVMHHDVNAWILFCWPPMLIVLSALHSFRMGGHKPRGLNAARKLRRSRQDNRWADKAYKKAHFGTALKANPFGGCSHAKGIVVEKVLSHTQSHTHACSEGESVKKESVREKAAGSDVLGEREREREE